MTQWTKKKLRTNIIILFLALILAIVLFYFTENPWFFSASIISLQDAEKMKENNRDIWYKNDSNMLDVFISEEVKDISNLTISIIYDPDNTEINPENLVLQDNLQTDTISEAPWVLVLKITDFTWWFDYQNSLFELPFTASDDIYNALVSEAVVVALDGENKPLSIWLLNESWDSVH